MLLKKNLLLVFGSLVFAVSAFASSTTTYYANLTINKTGETGKGTVYYGTSSTKPGSATSGAQKSAGSTTSGTNATYYYWVDLAEGYNATISGAITAGPATGATLSGSVGLAQSSSSGRGTSYTATANIVKVTVNSVTPTSIALDPTDPSADYPFTVTFATSNMKTIALDLTKTPESSDGKFTDITWSLDGTNVKATGKFNGGGTYGGASRNNSTTISLQSKAASSAAFKCTVTANFPALEFVGAEATDVFTTTSDATKTGTATYTFNYAAEDDFPTTPTIVHTSGSGAFAVTGYTVTPNFSTGVTTVTVNYSFNPNGAAGETKEQLRLTSVAGTNYDVTLTATAEAEATDDAKVIKSDGTTLIYQGDWATALTKANANAGCTLQLLRNVDLGTLAAIQSVTNTFTLDLNGKILSGTVSSTVTPMLYMNASGKTLTIKDSKTGGKISATGTHTNALYCVFVNNGNVILNSGTIEIENTNTKQTTADRLYATGVYVNSGKTFTMNGGSIKATRKARDAYGVYVAAKATSRGKATINNGTITANGNTYAYGIRGYGDIIINNGTINAETLTGAYAFGVYVRAAASATASSGYAGSLTMSGGTINSTSKTSYAYGIYMQTSTVGTGVTETPEGTHSNQECGVLKITGGTIRVINDGNVASTNQYAYGIYMDGDYSSKSAKHITQTIKNLNLYVEGSRYIYGIYAAAGAQTNSACNKADVALTDNTVEMFANQSVTAYAVYVGAANRTIYNTTANYAGEYASAAKVTINSGTYKARTTTTNAYAVCSATRTRTTFAPDHSLGGNAEAYPTLIIKGGDFIANSGTTTARAVSSGGNTTITGGTFTANVTTTTAYGIYSVAGNLNVTAAEINAEANSTAMGIVIDGAISTISGFSYTTNATLKNLTVTATTRTGAEADAVMIANYKRNLTPATLKSDSSSNKWSTAAYNQYANIYNYGEYAIAPKCTINGGTYTAKAATTTAYGIRLNGPAISADSDEDGNAAYAYGELNITNAEILAQTNGTTTCYGVWTGGPTTITNSTITAEAKTTTARGLFIEAGKTTISGSTITATGTETVQGIYVNCRLAAVNSTQTVNTEFSGVAGFECIGELESTNNTVTATATSGNTSYAIYLNAVKGNTASGPFAGAHGIGASATINSGTYTATASGTTAYGIGLAAQQVQVAGSVVGRPECTVNAGKFWGAATGGTDGAVNGSGQMGYFVLKGGFYNKNTNLAKYVEEGKNVNDVVSPSPEFTEGYRYTISSAISGAVVCRVYQGSTEKGAYKTLKEALQFVNANSGTNYTIVMVGNHTLPKGNYILPAKATLVVPESLTRKAAMGTRPTREAVSTPAPVQFLMLTFDKGVNMTVYGTIETTAKQNAANGGSAIAGAPHGNFGRLHLVAGSKITLESGSNLNCWGYTTGKGEITAMSGSTVREGFQLGYWRGGTATSSMLSNRGTWHAFPVTDYFIQNVEAPVLFRPGSTLYGYSAVNVSYFGIQEADDIKLVGTTGAMFLMDNADASADTWVKKEYDAATDRAVWTVNSGSKLGQFSFSLAGYGINSADYYLPVSNNMTININEGEFTVTQDALLIPGAQINISKLGKLTVASGKRLFVMDNEDWPGFQKADGTVTRWYYNALYSPSWTTNPRTTMYPPTTTRLPDAEIFVHGTTEGQYYTTTHGANIHSTNADAGVVRFVANAGANTSIQHVVNTDNNRVTITFTTAQLKNEDTLHPYTSSVGTVAGEAFTYMDNMWVKTRENGCLLEKTDGSGTHQLAHPSDVVAVVPNTGDNAYHSETGSRNFVFAEKAVTTAGCTWWEAEKVTSGAHAGDYMANQDRYDNYGGYFYWDGSAGYWKPRYVTVTWQNYDGTTLATYTNVQYNTSPRYTGATPKVPATTSTASYSWAGWKNMTTGVEYDRDETLPRVDGNVTYKAVVPETKFEYLITFKNDAGKVIHTEMFEAGSTPVCPPEKIVKASTASQDFTFSSWSPALTTVTGSATYTANFTASPRKYTVTFVDYDMTFLADTLINYKDPAAYPALAEEPYRESTDAFSYDWIGWTKALAKVTKDVTYVAKYKQTTLKYKVIFKSDCWGQNDGDDGCVEKIHRSIDYALGANPAVPANPSRPATAQYTFTFKEWTPAVVPVAVGGATYTAVYTKTPRSYAITYKDKNNAAFTGTHAATYPETHTYLTSETLDKPTRTGYTFEGWYTDKECAVNKVTKMPADIAAATTLYANWTPNTNTAYTVEHCRQALDGSYPDALKETENLTGTTATSVTPDRKEYTGFKAPAAQNKTILADGSLVITYLYTRNTYTLKWVLGSGAVVTVAGTGAAVDATGSPSASVKFEDAITAPTVTRTGYTFAGWDATPATKMPAVATTYVAQWTPITYNITYKDKGGIDFTGVLAEGSPTTHTYATATALKNPTKTGYTFGGWFIASDCSGTKLTTLAATAYTADITLHALWTVNSYAITYKNQGNATFTGTHEEGYPTTHTYDATTTLDSPTRVGYTFSGWYTSSDCSTGLVTTIGGKDFSAPFTLYAKWTPITYNIIYKDQDGAAFSGVHGAGYPTKHTYATATALVNPTKAGYTFGGWFIASDCSGTKLTLLAATAYTADITLYAKWTANTKTPYVVNHYQQNIDDDGYTLVAGDVQNLTGTTDTEVTPAVKSYTGFTSPSTQTVNINGDGSRVVNYYYTRNSYTLTWVTDGDALTGTYTSGSVRYGKTIFAPNTPTKMGYTFNSWSPAPAETMPAEAQTYTAIWDANDMGDYMDIIDWDGTTLKINMNGYVGSKGLGDPYTAGTGTQRSAWTLRASKDANQTADYHHSDAKDNKMILDVDLTDLGALTAGQEIAIAVYAHNGALDSYHTYTVPKVYNANATLSGTNAESIILVRSGKLSVNANATVKDVYVYPGAELFIKAGVTLIISGQLVLRTEGTNDDKAMFANKSAVLTNNGNISCSKVFYSRISRNNLKAYQIGFPFDVDLTKASMSSQSYNRRLGKSPFGSLFGVLYYDAASRAESGPEAGNWIGLDPSSETTMNAKQGYQIIAASGSYCEFYFPVSYIKPADDQPVAISAYAGDAEGLNSQGEKVLPGDKGWNYIVSPYTHEFTFNASANSDPAYDLKITELILWNGTSGEEVFQQYSARGAKIKPASPFYIQAPSAGTLSFSPSGSQFVANGSGPNGIIRRAPEGRILTQWLNIYYGSEQGDEDQTNIYTHPNKFSIDYEAGLDLAKYSKSGVTPKIYSTLACGDLAFTALPDSVASQRIPLTVYAPKADEMYFTMQGNDFIDRLESVLLFDTQTGAVTNLLFNDYYYYAEQGTQKGRFFIQPVFRKEGIATDFEQQTEDGALIVVDNKTITISGINSTDIRCFDATGKLIAIGKASDNNSVVLNVPAAGIYFIQAGEKVEKVIVK